MNVRKQVRLFLEPRSVAIIGESRESEEGLSILRNLLRIGFPGPVFPVNPHTDQILGIRCYSAVAEIPEAVDLAIISTPRDLILTLAEQSIHHGIKALIVVAQGFADADEEGRTLQEGLVRMANASGVRILGPNTLGIVNAFQPFTSSFMEVRPEKNPVAIVCQTGGFYVGFCETLRKMGKGVDIGNGCDIEVADFLDYFGDDPDIRVIVLYIEGIKDGQRFLKAASRVSRKKPILALKTGRSERGARSASFHTGALVGDDGTYTAAFRQSGVIRASDLEELEDLTRTFLFLPRLKRWRIGVVSMTGAGNIMIADAFEDHQLELAELSPETIKTVERLSPTWMPVNNPVDLWPAIGISGHGYCRVYKETLQAFLDDPNVDLVVCVSAAPFDIERNPDLDASGVIRDLAVVHPLKPVFAYFYGPYLKRLVETVEKEGKVLSFPSVERMARALGAVKNYTMGVLAKPLPHSNLFVSKREAQRLLRKAKQEERLELGLDESLAIFEAYGFPLAKSKAARGLREIVKTAGGIGYPLALKACPSGAIHKTDIGGVILNIQGPKEMASAYRTMKDSLRTKALCIKKMVVQQMVVGGHEVILGVKRDLQFGPVLMVGMGGVYTEVWKDVSLGIAPIDRRTAERIILETRVGNILEGVRGERPYDTEALIEILLRLSQLACDFPEISEVDINPIKVLETGAFILDSRIRLR